MGTQFRLVFSFFIEKACRKAAKKGAKTQLCRAKTNQIAARGGVWLCIWAVLAGVWFSFSLSAKPKKAPLFAPSAHFLFIFWRCLCVAVADCATIASAGGLGDNSQLLTCGLQRGQFFVVSHF